MKKRFENLCFLLAYAWKKCKALYSASLGKAVFNALLPLIDIAGLGLIVDALVNNRPRHEVMRLILYFLLFNLGVALLSQLLTLGENMIMRKASDITQRDYMYDSIQIDYHYIKMHHFSFWMNRQRALMQRQKAKYMQISDEWLKGKPLFS